MVIFEDSNVDLESSVFIESKVPSPESDDSNYFSDEEGFIFEGKLNNFKCPTKLHGSYSDLTKSHGDRYSLKDSAFSLDNLSYRGEGNCSLVIALKKVCRKTFLRELN